MTDEEIHNIYLHMSGKAEGLVEATGKADFPVMFARAILEYEGMTKDAPNMASKSTYTEQLGWVKIDEVREHFESVSCGTIYKNEGEGRVPLYASPQQRKPLTDKEIEAIWKVALFADYGVGAELSNQPFVHYARAIEAKLKEKNT